MERILDAAREQGVVMECNAAPERLDLKDIHLRMAKERGVKIVISTDAHSTRGLSAMRYGVQMARRGWLEKKDVINTLPVETLLATLRQKPEWRPKEATCRGCLERRCKGQVAQVWMSKSLPLRIGAFPSGFLAFSELSNSSASNGFPTDAEPQWMLDLGSRVVSNLARYVRVILRANLVEFPHYIILTSMFMS